MGADSHIIDLLPAYAIDCLDEDETILVSEHLAVCSSCRAELHSYEAVVELLPRAAPTAEPPVSVKQSLLERIQMASQSEEPVETGLTAWQSLVHFFRNLSPAWGLASLALILVLAAGNLVLWRQVSDLSVVNQPASMRVINLSNTDVAPGASGLIVISADGDHGTLVVDHLPQLSKGKQYQLWLIQNGQRTSGGIFSVDLDGYGSLWVSSPQPLIRYSSFGVTVEPAGGSPGPTGSKVLGGGL